MRRWIALMLILTACEPKADHLWVQEATHHENIVGGIDVTSEDPINYKALSFNVITETRTTDATDAVTINRVTSQCTASAIAPRIILTAAHCVTSSATVHRIQLPTADGKVEYFNAIKFIRHPGYETDKKYDLALVLLERALPENVQLLKLPAPDMDLKVQSIEAAGYGRAVGRRDLPGLVGKLRKVTLNVFDYSPTSLSFNTDQSQGKGICQGDSGGPALYELNGEPYVIGVVSKTQYLPTTDAPLDYCNYLGVYVNVQPFVQEWILPTMNKLLQE